MGDIVWFEKFKKAQEPPEFAVPEEEQYRELLVKLLEAQNEVMKGYPFLLYKPAPKKSHFWQVCACVLVGLEVVHLALHLWR